MTNVLTRNRLPYLHFNARSRQIPYAEIHRVYWEETRRGIPPEHHFPYRPDADLEYAKWQ